MIGLWSENVADATLTTQLCVSIQSRLGTSTKDIVDHWWIRRNGAQRKYAMCIYIISFDVHTSTSYVYAFKKGGASSSRLVDAVVVFDVPYATLFRNLNNNNNTVLCGLVRSWPLNMN